MPKNIAQPGRTQMTTERKHIACCIPKATNTRSNRIYLLHFDFINGCTKAPVWYFTHKLPILL
jgi:hypothetical protein